MKAKPSNRLLFVLCRFLASPAIFVSFLGSTYAVDQTYLDANSPDTWNLADANWNPGGTWTDNNTAIFGGTGETVTVGTVTADGITFNSAGYTLTGGTLTLGQSSTPIAVNSDVTINSIIAGSGMGFAKSGNGTLTLGGANTFSGLIDVNAGTLKLGAATGLGSGSGSVLVLSGATVDAAGFAAGARPLSISGTGVGNVGAIYNSSLVNGASVGAVTLDANASVSNAYTPLDSNRTLSLASLTPQGNKLTISSGVISCATQSINSGDIDINSGAALYYTTGGALTNVSGTITVKTGGRLDTRDSNNSGVAAAHTIALNGGVLSNGGIVNNNGGGIGAILKNNVTVDATNGGTISAVSSGFGLSIKLLGSISGSGPLTITNNGVEFRGDGSGYIGTATATGGTITFNPSAAQVFNGILAGTRPVTKTSSFTTTLGGNNTYSGATTVSAGTLTLTGSNTGTGTTAVNAGTLKLDFSTNNNRKIPSGALTLGGGSIELSGGTLFTDSVASTALTNGTVSTITRTSGTNLLDLKAITPNTGRLDFAQGGIAKTTNPNNAQGILGTWATVGGTSWAKNDGTGLIVAVTPTLDVTRLSTVAQIIPNNSAADVRITEGSGTAANIGLAAATTTINSLIQSAVGGTSPAIIDPAGQTLAVNNLMVGSGAGSLTIGTGSNNGTLKSAGTALVFRDLASAGITVNSVIADGTGASSLTKYDPGTLTLGGANTHTGGTTINDGTLRLGNASALPTASTPTLNNAANLDLNGFSISLPSLAGASTSTVTDNAASPGTSTLSFTNATGTISNKIVNGATRTVALRVTNANTSFALNNASNTFSGGIILAHNATGTRMQPGTITAGAYGTGPITVGESATNKAGIFFATASQTLANPIIANTGLGTDRVGTVRIATTGIILSGQITANLAPFTLSNSTGETGTVTASGKVTGPNGVTLLSSSLAGNSLTLTLSNTANDYAGDTIINQSPQSAKSFTLTLGASEVIPNGLGKGNVIINTNGTGVGKLNLAGFSESINGLSGNGSVEATSGTPTLSIGSNNATASFSGTLANGAGTLAINKIGSGTQTLSGVNTHTGATTISAGTLAISGLPTGNSAINLNGGNLTLDYSAPNDGTKIHDLAVLTLNGGSITLVGDNASHTELVAGTTLNGGVTLNRSGTNNQAKLALGAITRNTGGSLEVASAGLATTSTGNNPSGYLSGVTLAGGLAMNDGSGNIVAYTGSYTDVNRLGGTIADGPTNQVRIINSGTSGNITVGGAAGTFTISTLTNTSNDGLATIDIASGRILRLGAAGSIISPASSLGLTINGSGTLTAGGADNTAGDLLVLNQSSTATSIGASIANNGTGVVSLTKSGSGALNLTGVNTFTGGVRLNEGSITALLTTAQNSLGTGAVTVSGGTTLAINDTNTTSTVNVGTVFSGGGTLQVLFANAGSARNLVFNGITPLANFTGTLRLSLAAGATTTGDKLSVPVGTIPGSLLIDSNTQFVANTGSTTFSSGITLSGIGNTEGRGAIRLIGTLGGNLYLAGDTSIGTEGGTLSGNIYSAATGTQTLTFGTTNSGGNTTASGSIGGGTGTINLLKTKGGTVTLSGSNSFTGTVVIDDGILVSGTATGLGTATQITVANNDASANNTNALQLGGGFTQGSGTTLTLYNSATSGTIGNARPALSNQAGNNTWAGNIVLRGGVNQTLSNDIGSTTLTVNGTISQHGSEPSTGLFIRGTTTGVINGVMSLGTATLTKTDTGTWTIASSGNTWGATGVAVGTLKLGASNALPATTTVTIGQGDSNNVTLDLNGFNQTVAGLVFSSTGGTKVITSTAAATFTLNSAGANSYGGVLSGTGLALTKSGAGTLTLTGANTNGGITTISAGTLQVGNAGSTGALGNGNVVDNGTLSFNRTDAITVANVISGSGSLTQAGAGSVNLTGINTYTGNTAVNAGTLALADNARLTFAIGASSGTNNSLTGSGTVTLDGDFAIDLSAASALGSGTWVLENAASLPGAYGATFQVVDTTGTPWTDAGSNKWTKVSGTKTWTFDETTGTLTLVSSAYDTWASVIPNPADRDRGDDPDGDGFTNIQEYLFGGSPIAGTGSLVSSSTSGSNLILRWLQLETGGTYTLKESTTLLGGSWTTVVSPVPALDGDQSGAPTGYDYFKVTLPFGTGKKFYRIEAVEN